jgi:poly-gamma-glutamate synthesis protein (capsule biosynthesis protein)
MNRMKFTIVATGDSFIVKRIADKKLGGITDVFKGADAVFTNLETTVHDYEDDCYPMCKPKGDWGRASIDCIRDMKEIGINMYGLPNNHTFDFMENGVLRTIENLNKIDALNAGTGKNLFEASKPVYLDTPNGRIALIAFSTTFVNFQRAGEQRRDMVGRPGMFTIGHDTFFKVSAEELETIKEIEKRNYWDGIGMCSEIMGDRIKYGNTYVVVGEGETLTKAHDADLKRLQNSIEEARRQADLVLTTCHSHERKNYSDFLNPQFLEEIAHFCIDCGADAYMGHGPHVMRGIEIYKNSPIFYSAGNLFYECELLDRAPEDMYAAYPGLDKKDSIADIYDFREIDGALGETDPNFFQAFIGEFVVEDGKLSEVKIYPIDLQFEKHRSTKGTPIMASGKLADDILKKIQELSTPYGTKIIEKNGIGYLQL